VRETERRANGGAGRAKLRAAPDPDLVDALMHAEEALESALGHGVRVRAAGKRGALRAEIQFDDLDALLEFARSRR
jgi:hypothetical protein